MELRNQVLSSYPLTASVYPPERVTGPSKYTIRRGTSKATRWQQRRNNQKASEAQKLYSIKISPRAPRQLINEPTGESGFMIKLLHFQILIT